MREVSALRAALYCAAFLFGLAGCATTDSFGGSRAAVVAWAAERGYSVGDEVVGELRLLSLTRIRSTSNELSVYIEGDGAAWPTRYRPPHDPTPIQPTALAMAATDTAPMVVYLGRPCQYLDPDALAACDPALWTMRRYAADVVAAYHTAIERAKTRWGANRLRLYGYSGGGVIAALLAQQRTDVAGLVTVAAPLALLEWTTHHHITALTESLDPLHISGYATHAVHWAGGRDKVVPRRIIEAYAEAKPGKVIVEPDFDHVCCWSRDWPRLLELSR